MLSHILEEELANPWGGDLELAEAQQRWARDKYDWAVRAPEWEAFVRDISRNRPTMTFESGLALYGGTATAIHAVYTLVAPRSITPLTSRPPASGNVGQAGRREKGRYPWRHRKDKSPCATMPLRRELSIAK